MYASAAEPAAVVSTIHMGFGCMRSLCKFVRKTITVYVRPQYKSDRIEMVVRLHVPTTILVQK